MAPSNRCLRPSALMQRETCSSTSQAIMPASRAYEQVALTTLPDPSHVRLAADFTLKLFSWSSMSSKSLMVALVVLTNVVYSIRNLYFALLRLRCRLWQRISLRLLTDLWWLNRLWLGIRQSVVVYNGFSAHQQSSFVPRQACACLPLCTAGVAELSLAQTSMSESITSTH